MARAATALLLLLAVSAGCSSLPGHADAPAPVVRGPIPSRNLEPVKLTHLAFRPRRAATLPEGETQVGVLSAYANIFENAQVGGERVDFDGEIWRTSAHVRRALGAGADLEIEVPIVFATSGFLDAFIEEFHELFGMPNGGREDQPRFQYDMVAEKNGVQAYELDHDEVGLGDVPIVLTVALVDESGSWPGVAVRAGVELPTGSESEGFGNGGLDYGIGLLAERSFGRWTATGGVDWVDAESSEEFEDAGLEAKDGFGAQAGVEYRWNDRWSLLAGSVYAPPPTDDIELEEISGPMLSLDLGLSWDVGGRSRLLFVFSEDLITQSAPDFTVTAAWTMSL